MAKKNKTVKELDYEFEILSERIRKLEEKDNASNIQNEENRIEKIETMLKHYDEKIKHLDSLLEESNAKNLIKSQTDLRCRVCKEG